MVLTRGFSQWLTAAALMAGVAAPASGAQDNPVGAQQQPPIQARPGGPETSPRTDQTVDVAKGTRLVLSNNAGEVVVRSWERDQVRVQATHSDRANVEVSNVDATLRIRSRAARGPAGLIDYQLTVPRWMAVNLAGTYLESTIEGTTAEVTVESVHGNIRVVGGFGNVNLRSVEGVITVDKATGNLRAVTINEEIRLTNISGDVYAETTNGDITIQNAQTTSLEVSTVNGDVTFNGSMRDGGAYRLTTHGGDLRVGLGGAKNATVFVRTFQGDFMADFPIQLPDGQSAREGSKRFNFTLGSGSARIELQTFNGDITLARESIATVEELRRQRRGIAPSATPSATPKPKPAPKPPGGDWTHFESLLEHEWDHAASWEVTIETPVPHVEFDVDFDAMHRVSPTPAPTPEAPPPAQLGIFKRAVPSPRPPAP